MASYNSQSNLSDAMYIELYKLTKLLQNIKGYTVKERREYKYWNLIKKGI